MLPDPKFRSPGAVPDQKPNLADQLQVIKALTICQPYPRLILTGEKHVENRTWYTRYRGRLLIHAGKSREWIEPGDEEEAIAAGDPLEFGAIVGEVILAACVRVEDIEAGRLDKRFPQLANRAHCGGPWCWVLTGSKRYPNPIPWRGSQGLFDVPETLVSGDAFGVDGKQSLFRKPVTENLFRGKGC